MKLIYIIFLFCGTGFAQDVIDPFTPFSACENLYTEQNAINDCDEANDASGISLDPITVGTGTATSSTSFPDTGTYSVRFLHTGGVNERLRWTMPVSVVSGRVYQVTVRNYRDTGSNNWYLRLGGTAYGWTTTQTNRTAVLDGYETLTATATANITGTAYIAWDGDTGADGGDDNYWASLTVTDVTP